MMNLKTYAGLYLIILGTLTLAATRIPSLGRHNSLLTGGLLLIVAGILLHIRAIKRQSDY